MSLAKRVAEGVTAKLAFDYACHRGHSFGETHIHAIVNEVLTANIHPAESRVHAGFPHPRLGRPGKGRKPEIDFAVLERASGAVLVAAEVKWAGSGHCTPCNVLKDLIRLQIIADAHPSTDCIMVIAGHRNSAQRLFSDPLFLQGTHCMLVRSCETVTPRAAVRRKAFSLRGNRDHQDAIDRHLAQIRTKVPAIPDRITSSFMSPAMSAPKEGRFHTFAWRIHPSTLLLRPRPPAMPAAQC